MEVSKPTFDFTEVSRQIEKASGKGLPPVDKWQPKHSGDIDIRILRDGTWLYNGTPIGRIAMVKLFATVLWKEKDAYFLKTPVEKMRIQVEDAPFHFIHVEKVAHERGEALCFISLTGDKVIASAENPIRVETDPLTGEPSPYLYVRFGMEGLINRSVFYSLVEMAHEESIEGVLHVVIRSAGESYVLGRVE
ncbi:DUF1285 domain-containing protein [Neptunomonas sp.]|uniref:DUF1285 domain-containing protein n=1 Tax=Neptunomonas sp. TaxID=1971898 RepID=UPI0025E767F9|nr:DUF1285 domain-containing protein [Neptunomonas sp.]